MKLNRNKIIKAFKCCNDDGDCSVCPYERARFVDELECTEELHADALFLIKELTEEINDLTATVKVKSETIEELQFFVSKISEDNRKLTEDNEAQAETITNLIETIKGLSIKTVDSKVAIFPRFKYNGNTCVCCGAVIPEGIQVCPQCENKSIESENKNEH